MASVSRKSGRIEPTPRYQELLEMAGDIKPVSISISAGADVFAGSEIDRSQVQQFVALLTRVAMVAHAGLVLITHPSLTGISSGTGLSGSTQWHNSVRARFYLKRVKPSRAKKAEDGLPDDEPDYGNDRPDNNRRVIEFHKNNYGPMSGHVLLRYENGLFVPVVQSTADQAARRAEAERIFLTVLRRFAFQKQDVSPHGTANNYAPTVVAAHPDAKGFEKREMQAAMQRLLDRGEIHIAEEGPPSKRQKKLVPGPRTLL
jgi:RecA-family ATPase